MLLRVLLFPVMALASQTPDGFRGDVHSRGNVDWPRGVASLAIWVDRFRPGGWGPKPERPPFDKPRYDIRRYHNNKYVCTSATGDDSVFDSQYDKLFNYFIDNGITKSEPLLWSRAMSDPDTTFTLCAYIPSEYQDSPPAPSDAAVTIEDRNWGTVAVRKFSSSLYDWQTFQTEADTLKADLKADINRDLDAAEFISAVVGNPQYSGVHREVWIKTSA